MTTITRIPWVPTEAERNLIPNPWPRTNTGGWATLGAASSLALVDGYIQCTLTAPGTASRSVVSTLLPVGQGVHSGTVRVMSSAAVAVQIRLNLYNAAGTYLYGLTAGPRVMMTPGVARPMSFVDAVIADPLVTQLRFVVEIPTGEAGLAGDTLAVQRAVLKPQATVGAYFDGTTPNTAIAAYGWTGTANNSASVMEVPSAADQVVPLTALAPFVAARESRTIVHTLLNDPAARFTYVPPGPASGVLDLGFESYAAALAARDFLSGNYRFALDDALDGPPVVWRVAGGALELKQEEEVTSLWHVLVPWVEAAA